MLNIIVNKNDHTCSFQTYIDTLWKGFSCLFKVAAQKSTSVEEEPVLGVMTGSGIWETVPKFPWATPIGILVNQTIMVVIKTTSESTTKT